MDSSNLDTSFEIKDSNEIAYQRVKLARHPDRPFTLDLIENIFEQFVEIYGDRRYSDDKSLMCGFASFGGKSVVVIGQQKGRDTKQRQFRNFGMPKPEGYRKALRAMKLAEKFNCPIFTFVDTPGAYPGIDAEERGQAEAIARNLLEMARLKVPIIVTIIGEGGSGGALAIAVGDRVIMLENAIYSVISPEGCAAILWKDAAKAPSASQALKLTANELRELGLVDDVVEEPEGGAQSNHAETFTVVKNALINNLNLVEAASNQELLTNRYKKLREFGKWGLL